MQPLVNTPEFYFMNTPPAAYLCRRPNTQNVEAGAKNSSFFEICVVSEMSKAIIMSENIRIYIIPLKEIYMPE